ncbi:MAG: hypothetical protein ABJE47_16495 [bacterium]
MSLQQCGNNYCPNNKSMIDGDCHDLDYQAGNKIVLIPPGTTTQCWCVCSCLAVNTPISTPDGTVKVQDIVSDQTVVLAAGLDLTWTDQVVHQASFATPGLTEHTIYIRFQIQGESAARELVVTRDHPLVLYPDKKLIVADYLQLTDMLIDRDGQSVQVLDVSWGSYAGSFYEFATSLTPPDANYTNHLVLTNGIVSGDFAIQVYSDIPAGPSGVAAVAATGGKGADVAGATSGARHEVGSEEWITANTSQPKATAVSALRASAPVAGGLAATANRSATLIHGNLFSPAALIVAPDHASDFLPPAQAKALKKYAPKHSIGDMYYHQLGDYVIGQFKCLYPDVTFVTSWYNSAVNAHSFITNGKKHVLLNGGLMRIVGFEYAGIALAIAHEVGHLYGTPDGSPLGVTCEGEADYYGAKIALRKLWFGELYGDFMFQSVAQLKLLYSYLTDPSDGENDKAGRRYPSNECRLDTIAAAMAGQPIPECAACGIVDWSATTLSTGANAMAG